MEAIKGKRNNLGSTSHDNDTEAQEKSRMIKPQVHTTKYGTQSVSPLDIIQSEVGWAEIERILDANLVQEPTSQNGSTGSTAPKNGDAA